MEGHWPGPLNRFGKGFETRKSNVQDVTAVSSGVDLLYLPPPKEVMFSLALVCLFVSKISQSSDRILITFSG